MKRGIGGLLAAILAWGIVGVARAQDAVEAGWLSGDATGRMVFHTGEAKEGDVAGYRIHAWNKEMVSQIGAGEGAFGLELGNSDISDDGIAQVMAIPGAARRLVSLNIGHTAIDDAGLKTIAGDGTSSLVSLNMFATKLTDEGLAVLPTFKRLRYLNLGSARSVGKKPLTDAGMKAVGLVITLESLDLDAESVTDAGLASFARLSELRVLDLPSTKVNGSGVKSLEGLAKLETLVLAGDAVTDETVEGISGMTQLKNLNLDRSKITDAGMVKLHGLHLKTLSVTRTAVTANEVANWKIPVKWGTPATKPAQSQAATQK